MLTVNDLAVQSDVPAHVVRYYLRIGLILPTRHQANGYRLFEDGDIRRLRFIRMAKNLGFTLNEIRQIVSHATSGESPCPEVRRIIELRIKENRRRIDEMVGLQERMESALKRWKKMPDGMPNGDSICHLIEKEAKHYQ